MLTDVDACTETYSESSAKNNPVYSGLPIDFILPGHPSSFWYAVPSKERGFWNSPGGAAWSIFQFTGGP